ncbi:hypothetical protein ACKGJO_05280 [Gracilimonas sp. Q87]|uniref:hypothetical protein n=1 Tax=Gracilimonas sp. Q87 TaxID=3384766 RepID=UPI003983FD77
MKNYYINKLQTEDIKPLLQDYCNEHYIPFLKNSDRRKQRERYKKLVTEQDKQEAINKFVKKYTNRIYILLSSLYDPDNTEGSYHFDWYFREQSCKWQQDILSIEHRKFLLKFCYKNRLIERDNRDGEKYVSPNAGLAYTRCYKYRVNPKYYRDEHTWQKRFRLRITKKYFDSLNNKKKAKYKEENTKPKPSEFGLQRKEHFDEWVLDEDRLPEDLLPVAEDYKKQKKFYTDNSYKEGRDYHNNNLADKRLRPFMRHISEPKGTEHQIVELSNSFQYFLSTVLVEEMDLSKKELEQVNYMGQVLHQISKKSKKELIDVFVDALRDKDSLKMFYWTLDLFFDLKYKYGLDIDTKTNLIEFEDQKRRQLTLYVLMSLAGITYDVLMEFDPDTTDRSKFKKDISTMINKSNEYNWKRFGVDEIYMDYFIEVYRVMMKWKEYHHKNLGHIMSQFESKFIHSYEEKLLTHDIPFMNIFDGIMVNKDIALNLLTKMAKGSKEKYGMTAPLKLDAVA